MHWLLHTVTSHTLLYCTATFIAAVQGGRSTPLNAVDATTPHSQKAFSPSAARHSRTAAAAMAAPCARCEGPWQTDFAYMLRANLWRELTDKRRTWPLADYTELTDAELAVRMREMFGANEVAGDSRLLKLWMNFEVVEREETRLFHDHFEKNLSSPTAKRVFHEMRRILSDQTLLEYEKCFTITNVLRANDKACLELRQQQPYKKQVKTQRPFGPIAPSFILASVEEAERARAVDIWLNATTRFHAPLHEMAADFSAWLQRQSSPSVTATFEALSAGSEIWLERQFAAAKRLSKSQNTSDVLDRILAIFLADGDDSGAQVCLKIFNLLAQIDKRTTENKHIAALRQSIVRCGASDSVRNASDAGGSDFLRAHFLHGVTRYRVANPFQALLTMLHD